MENCTPQETVNKAKLIVKILNEAKQRSFSDKQELRDFLKNQKCPYNQLIVPYLYKIQEIVYQGDSKFICFRDRKPYYFGDFISIIDRFRKTKGKFNRTYNIKRKLNEVKPVTTQDAQRQETLVETIIVTNKNYSKWNKFWIKLFFGLTV